MRFSAFTTAALLALGAAVSAQEFDNSGEAPVRLTVTQVLKNEASAKALTPPPFDGNFGASTFVTIAGVRYSGSGCPSRTVIPGIDSTFTIVTLKFYRYDLKLDQYSRALRARKTCNIRILFRSPTGYQFSAVSYAISGSLFLSSAQVGASVNSVIYLGNNARARSPAALNYFGPYGIPGTPAAPPVPGTPDVALPILTDNQATDGDTITPGNPVVAVFINPWWSVCPPNHGPVPLGSRFEKTTVALDTSITLTRFTRNDRAYIAQDQFSGVVEKGILLQWQDCAALWGSAGLGF